MNMIKKILAFFRARPLDPQIKVLAVDDEETSRRLISRAIEKAGFTSVMAATGKEGVNFSSQENLKLIILDIHLPDMDGVEVCKAIRNNPKTNPIPILFLTAVDRPTTVVESFQEGGDDYFMKPVTISLLARKIQEMVRERHEDFLK